jgi:hypothetical protein
MHRSALPARRVVASISLFSTFFALLRAVPKAHDLA